MAYYDGPETKAARLVAWYVNLYGPVPHIATWPIPLAKGPSLFYAVFGQAALQTRLKGVLAV